MPKKIDILIVDDEQKFRENMSKRLGLRGFKVHHVGTGEEAIKQVRQYDVDVVLLDLKMPGMSGEETLREIRAVNHTCQVIIVTGHGSYQSATTTGKFDAFSYLEKTTDFEDLLAEIEAAKRNKVHALIREEHIPEARPSFKRRMMGVTNHRPLLIIIGFLMFFGIILIPTPQSLIDVVSMTKKGEVGEKIAGYAYYRKMANDQSVADYYGKYAEFLKGKGEKKYPVEFAAFKAKVMIALLVLAAFFWGTGAIPIGFAAILVGVVMYWFKIMPPELVAKSFLKDSVLFIFGVLAMSVGISRTGLDRRIGALLLGISTNIKRFLFLFCPLLAVTASFISEHALVAFIAPIMVTVYAASIRKAGIKEDRNLAITLILIITFVGNIGGPGSPSAGGRNAIMLGILRDYGEAPTYGQWMMYGMPFVPVMALVIGVYFYFAFYRKIKIKDVNISQIVKDESGKLGRMLPKEYMMAGILLLVILGWIFLSDTYGMGGPVLFGLVLMSVFRVVRWKDITHISWDVVALYSAATAMGAGLAVTGSALWIANGFISLLPDSMTSGTGLAVTCSLLTGLLTNLMSDGATVSVIGPLTTPMAVLSGTHPWMTGFATAFSSSFAHAMIVGTPNNAIVYAVAVDPETGKRLITLGDFFKHGGMIFLLSLAVLIGWAFFGYWQWLGFPAV